MGYYIISMHMVVTLTKWLKHYLTVEENSRFFLLRCSISLSLPLGDQLLIKKACGQKYLSTLLLPWPFRILPLLHPNHLWYPCQLLLHHCNILTITKWLLSRPFSTGLTNSGWWSSQWVAFITFVYNHHIVSSSIIADSTMVRLFWSAAVNSCAKGKWQGACYETPHKRYQKRGFMKEITVFLRSDVIATIFFFFLFLCSYFSRVAVIFFGKSADINDGLLRYIWVIQWQLSDAVSSKCSLSVPLLAVEMSCTA